MVLALSQKLRDDRKQVKRTQKETGKTPHFGYLTWVLHTSGMNNQANSYEIITLRCWYWCPHPSTQKAM